MSLKRNERYPGRFNNPTTAHPQGAFKNRSTPTSQDGSYLEADWMNDISGFLEAILTAANVAPNGTADTAISSQVYDALKTLFFSQSSGGLVLAGVPVPWPTNNIPAGWLKCNGSSFSGSSYPQLAIVYPSLILPDLRGEFIRGLDDTRGVDPGRTILSSQRGSLLLKDISDSVASFNNSAGDTNAVLDWDASQRTDSVVINTTIRQTTTVQPVSNTSYMGVSRPRNIAFNYIVRAV